MQSTSSHCRQCRQNSPIGESQYRIPAEQQTADNIHAIHPEFEDSEQAHEAEDSALASNATSIQNEPGNN